MAHYSMYTWTWCIKDYFQLSTEFLSRCRTGEVKEFISESNENNNMAKIDLRALIIQGGPVPFVSISIKSEQCVNLCRVRCYQIRNLRNGTIEEIKVANQEFSGLLYGWHPLVARNQFEQDSLYNEGCNRKNLTLKFEFIFKKNDKIELNQYLQTDLRTHLMNPAFSDIMIKTSEGDEVPAHKILLVARSDVFRAQFQHDTAEKSTNTVECPFETKVVKDLLSYIYYQDVMLNIKETAFKLLVAADYYHLDHLKELCGNVLTKQLNVDNAVELLTLADTHNVGSMKKAVLEFITGKKNAAEVVKTEEWKSISYELSKSIFEFTISKNCEN